MFSAWKKAFCELKALLSALGYFFRGKFPKKIEMGLFVDPRCGKKWFSSPMRILTGIFGSVND